MCTVMISAPKDKTLAMHKNADTKVKAALEQLFGKEPFQSVTDRVKTFEDACRVAGTAVANVINMDDSADEIAYKQLKVIAAALNEGWKPDWTNESEEKWYPWMEYKAGSGFSLHYVYYDYTNSRVPSRLCFKNAELAKYAATQFRDIYNEYFL